MNSKHGILSLLICSFLVCLTMVSNAQTYFKTLDNPELNFRQRTARFQNGDVLVADSSIEPLRTGNEEGIIYLTRLDNCGRIQWSYHYKITEGYLEFKDVQINEQDEVFLYGSFYKGLDEFIFLFKTDQHGVNQDYSIWSTGTIDHFSYSMDIQNDQVMVYGLMLGFQTQKRGFVAVFDQNLNFRWSKRFAPFESTGNAIITQDLGFIGYSGEYLIKLNAAGEYQWAQTLSAVPNVYTVSGPLEVSDGFIFQATNGEMGFFYKLNSAGNLLWQSSLFAAAETEAAMTLMDDGSILSTYTRPDGDYGALCQLRLSPNGQIDQQRELITSYRMAPGSIFQSVHKNQITIAVNENPFKNQGTDVQDFLFQFPLEYQTDNCFSWQDFDDTQTNNIDLNLTTYSFDSESFEMSFQRTIKSEAENYPFDLTEQCITDIDLDALTQDTLLPCEADFWEIQLPDQDFYWVDGTLDTIRQVEEPGTYTAINRDCINRVEVKFQLQKENCGCPSFLPTAFSPNGDSINDELVFFSDCPLNTIEITIFNRWGERVFHTQQLDDFWDGRYRQNEAEPGLYIAMISYEWIEEDGTLSTESISQEITLIR